MTARIIVDSVIIIIISVVVKERNRMSRAHPSCVQGLTNSNNRYATSVTQPAQDLQRVVLLVTIADVVELGRSVITE